MDPSTEHITRSCAECRKLIEQLLQAREQLQDAATQAPRSPRVAVLEDKVRKLQAATEAQFLKAMDSISRSAR